MTSEYYSILTDLSQRLSKDDLSNLVFSCGNILPASTAEKISTGIHLFRELKQRGHLGPANYDYLRKQLVLVGRHDLSSMLPDQFEIFFGRSSVRNKGHFGCIVSPAAPDTLSSMINISSPKCRHTNMESRMLLLQLFQQLNSEDSKKLAFLMYPAYSQLTALEFAQLLEREGGLHSISIINRLTGCLEAVGRVDLAQQLSFLKMPKVLQSPNSLSTSQLQLNLKMSLLLHSKQQSFDFYMRALSEVECSSEVRIKLLSPICDRIRDYFGSLSMTLLAHNLMDALKEYTATSHEIELDALINNSLLEALKMHQAYSMRIISLSQGCTEVPVEKFWKSIEQVHDSYNSFSSLMDILNWNSIVRDEFKINVSQCSAPYGTPAKLACKYILELSREVSQDGNINQDNHMIHFRYIQALNTNYYCCCYHLIVLQWLASLLCFFTTFGFIQLDLCKLKETLWHILQQKREEIMQSYSRLANIVGPALLQQLIPPAENTEVNNSQSYQNPFVLFFNALIIQLLDVATFSPDRILSQYYLIGKDEDLQFLSYKIMVSAADMKKQVIKFREKVLSEDPLCSHVIAALTDLH